MADTRVKAREVGGAVPRVIRHYRGYNISAPGANTSIITPVKFSEGASACRVTVALAVGSVFNVYVTDGSTAFTWGLNSSNALNAGDLYTFTFAVAASTGAADLTYTFRVETNGVIQQLIVDEVIGAVV